MQCSRHVNVHPIWPPPTASCRNAPSIRTRGTRLPPSDRGQQSRAHLHGSKEVAVLNRSACSRSARIGDCLPPSEANTGRGTPSCAQLPPSRAWEAPRAVQASPLGDRGVSKRLSGRLQGAQESVHCCTATRVTRIDNRNYPQHNATWFHSRGGRVVSVRKRQWRNGKGEAREAWVVDYVDREGKRRLKTFNKKKSANEFAAKARVEIGEGTHVADSASVTIKAASEMWLARCRASDLEKSTIEQYEQHVRLHIVPFIGADKLSKVTVPFVRSYQDALHSKGRSAAMMRAVIASLGALLGDAQERGLVVRNAVRELRGRPHRSRGKQDRRGTHLKIGTDIPTPVEVRSFLAHAEGRWRPLFLTAVFTGMRASELRGLRWDDVDLKRTELHVRQRADKYNVIGQPKSRSGVRTIPLTPGLARELREWKLQCPKKDGKLALVFPNGDGNVESHANIVQRGLAPTMVAAGITAHVLDEKGTKRRDSEGKPIVECKYTGLHALRHFFASWCINRRVDGGLELPAKVVQERLGHASIVMTMDRYGHLFPRGDDTAELALAESRLMGTAT